MSASAEAADVDGPALRARRTAAITRVAVGASGLALLAANPALRPQPLPAAIGFAVVLLTALLQLAVPRMGVLSFEESLSGVCALLIVGLGDERVNVLAVLWLTAVASGVLARGGRQHWLGPAIVALALALPIVREQLLTGEYAALCLATIALLLTSGRLTRELGKLLAQARLQASSAETLLLAGDIAARVAERSAPAPDATPEATEHVSLDAAERALAEQALAGLIAGRGLSMAVQPIVELSTGTVHAHEALARFTSPGIEGGPLHWFNLAEQLGRRPALERACVGAALELFARRPAGTALSLNVSVPVLMDPETQAALCAAGDGPTGLQGLIVEITEETLVRSEAALVDAFEPLRALGACLAVDDMGAGYSGLRQITSVRPRYLKLDRSLVTGVDRDEERAALLRALAGYSRQVGALLIAEGVETDDELSCVRELGAPLVQGFLLGRPASPWPDLSAPAPRGGGPTRVRGHARKRRTGARGRDTARI